MGESSNITIWPQKFKIITRFHSLSSPGNAKKLKTTFYFPRNIGRGVSL
jgi:hypothetical protein